MNTSLAVRPSSPLAFQNVTFDVIDRNGQPWLRSPQIADALGYANDNAVSRIYARHKDEFTDNMSGSVKLTLPGNLEAETRIFSLRGAHLLGMFARTPVAAEFRRWVLDILDAELERLRDPSRKISPEQYMVMKKFLDERHLPGELRERFVAKIQETFKIRQLLDLREIDFAGALEMIVRRQHRSVILGSKAQTPAVPAASPAPAVPAVAAARPFGGAETAWLTRFDCHNVGRTEQVPADSFVFRVSEIPDMVREPAGHVPRKMLPGIIDACVSRLK